MNSGVGQSFVRWTSFYGTLPWDLQCISFAPRNPQQKTINCWQSLIEFSPVWTDLPDMKVSLLLIVANIHQLRSPDLSGVTPSWAWWLCPGINCLCSYLPAAICWTVILTEVVPPSQREAMAMDTTVPFWNRATWIFWCPWWKCHCIFLELWHPLWQEAGGCCPWGGCLGQECELCSCSVASVWDNIMGLFKKSFRKGK